MAGFPASEAPSASESCYSLVTQCSRGALTDQGEDVAQDQDVGNNGITRHRRNRLSQTGDSLSDPDGWIILTDRAQADKRQRPQIHTSLPVEGPLSIPKEEMT